MSGPAGQCRAGQGRAGQDRAGQGSTMDCPASNFLWICDTGLRPSRDPELLNQLTALAE